MLDPLQKLNRKGRAAPVEFVNDKDQGTPRFLCDLGRQLRQFVLQAILGLSLVRIFLEQVSVIQFA